MINGNLILPSKYAMRRAVEMVGKRLWTLADLEDKPQELRDHYRLIALDRIKTWMGTGESLTPDTAGVLAFSIHSEAENSWYQLRGWLDEDEKLSIERDIEYLDIKEEEADYIAWLKKKGFME